jgi:hypothetical protein
MDLGKALVNETKERKKRKRGNPLPLEIRDPEDNNIVLIRSSELERFKLRRKKPYNVPKAAKEKETTPRQQEKDSKRKGA